MHINWIKVLFMYHFKSDIGLFLVWLSKISNCSVSYWPIYLIIYLSLNTPMWPSTQLTCFDDVSDLLKMLGCKSSIQSTLACLICRHKDIIHGWSVWEWISNDQELRNWGSSEFFFFLPFYSWLPCCPVYHSQLLAVSPGLWSQWLWQYSSCCCSSCFPVLWLSARVHCPVCLPWLWSAGCSDCTAEVCTCWIETK